MEEWFLFFASIACALVISHLCSLMEAAILSITPSQLAELQQRSPRIGAVVSGLKKEIDRPLAVILILNTAAHTIGAAVAGAQFTKLGYGAYMGVFSLIFTLVMVQYTELLPKTLGVRFNIRVLQLAGRPLFVAGIIMSPLIKLTKLINRPFEGRAPKRPTPAEEISALASMARSSQVISSRQERIIRMVPYLSERSAADVMIEAEDVAFLMPICHWTMRSPSPAMISTPATRSVSAATGTIFPAMSISKRSFWLSTTAKAT